MSHLYAQFLAYRTQVSGIYDLKIGNISVIWEPTSYFPF